MTNCTRKTVWYQLLRRNTGQTIRLRCDPNHTGLYVIVIIIHKRLFICYKLCRETALAIVSDEMQGLKALQFYKKEYSETSTPMRMLIKEMPGNKPVASYCKQLQYYSLHQFECQEICKHIQFIYCTLVQYDIVDIAEWVLNKCALSRQPVDSAPNDKHYEKTSRV